MELQEILEIRKTLQPWSPKGVTEYLYAAMAEDGIPFCVECGDWHNPDEEHSSTFEVE